ncbi:Creatinase [Chionoecetes opilio]|uniref:Creatinase n=1 Tax=Chionoecetes opilio TaxID=41210 RepID=A0A8J5BU05_CHIOP|nr:Creatinase [Chionoecetes opilio]
MLACVRGRAVCGGGGGVAAAAARAWERHGRRASSNDVNTFRGTTTMRLPNGEKQNLGLFSAGEVEGRVHRLRNHMEQEGLAACLFTSIHNVNYYTGGFIYCAFGRPYGLLVTPEKHVTISALIDAGQPWRLSPQVWTKV